MKGCIWELEGEAEDYWEGMRHERASVKEQWRAVKRGSAHGFQYEIYAGSE